MLVAERVSGTSSVAHALAFSHAVESLARDRGAAAGAGDQADPGRARAALQPPRGRPSASARTPRCRSPRPSSPCSRNDCTGSRAPLSGTATCAAQSCRAAPGIDLDRRRRRPDRLDVARLGARVAARAVDSPAHRLVPRPPGQHRSRCPSRTRVTSDVSARSPGARASTSTRGATCPTTAIRRSRS